MLSTFYSRNVEIESIVFSPFTTSGLMFEGDPFKAISTITTLGHPIILKERYVTPSPNKETHLEIILEGNEVFVDIHRSVIKRTEWRERDALYEIDFNAMIKSIFEYFQTRIKGFDKKKLSYYTIKFDRNEETKTYTIEFIRNKVK